MNTSELIKTLVKQCGPEDNIPLWYLVFLLSVDYFSETKSRIPFCLNVTSRIFTFSDYNRNLTDITTEFESAPLGDGVKTALWQLALALIFKGAITVFTFGIKVCAHDDHFKIVSTLDFNRIYPAPFLLLITSDCFHQL